MDNQHSYSRLAFVSLLFAFLSLAIPYEASALRDEHSLGPLGSSRSLFEIGIRLKSTDLLSYSFRAQPSGSIIQFNIHSHFDNKVQVYKNIEAASSSDSFTAPRDGDYYLVLENLGAKEVSVQYWLVLPKRTAQISWKEYSFNISIETDSEIKTTQFSHDNMEIVIKATTAYLARIALGGYLNVTVPKKLLSGEITTYIDGSKSSSTLAEDADNSYLSFRIPEGGHIIVIRGTKAIEVPTLTTTIIAMTENTTSTSAVETEANQTSTTTAKTIDARPETSKESSVVEYLLGGIISIALALAVTLFRRRLKRRTSAT